MHDARFPIPPVYANPGAALDPDPLTALRLQLLTNGYLPIAGFDKTCQRLGWSRLKVDADVIRSWKGSRSGRWMATNIRVEGGLAVVDLDSTDPALQAGFTEDLKRIAPEVAARALKRLGGAGGKFALFCRREEEEAFYRIQSRKWVKPEDINQPTELRAKHRLEVFAGRKGGRQFGSFGPHSRDERGVPVRYYIWPDPGRSPAEVPLADLPLLMKAQVFTLVDAFDRRAKAAGYIPVPSTTRGETVPRFVFDLTDDMWFVNDGGAYRLDQLDNERVYASHKNGTDFRVTSSFLGHGTNPTKCIVGWSERYDCVFIHNFEDACTHYPADRAPPPPFDMAAMAELLKSLGVQS